MIKFSNYFLKQNILFNNKDISKERIKTILNKKLKTNYGPEYVTLDITNRCNLNCIACWTYSPLLEDKKLEKSWFIQELSYETIKKLIEDLKKLKTKELRLTGGGEPFTHPKIMEIISLIKKNGFILDITTNFSLFSKISLEKLSTYAVDNITASIWAATPGTYTKTHPNQKEITFKRIKENLIYFGSIKKNTKLVIANVISNLNYHEIENMVDFACEVNADEIYFTMIDPIYGATDSLLLTKKQQALLKRSFKKIKDRYEKGEYGILKIDNPDNFLRRISGECNGDYDKNIVLDIPCTVGWTFSRIMANGDIAPCCRAVMIPSGNINKQSFKDIWNEQKQQRFRQIGLNLKENPIFIEKVGCVKTCDNLMHNIETFNKIKTFKKEN